MPSTTMTFSAGEIAALLADHVEAVHHVKCDPKRIRFEIEPACDSADPREHSGSATLTAAVVPVAA